MLNENDIWRLGFLPQKIINKPYVLSEIRMGMPNRKVLSIIGNICFNYTFEKYSYELDGLIDVSIKIYKCSVENGKHTYIFSGEGNYFEMKNVDAILSIAPTLKKNCNSGFVYIIKSKLGFKIGMSKNIPKRAKTFEVKLPFEWSFEKIYHLNDYRKMEKMLHELFEDKKIDGEWFSLTPSDFFVIQKLYEALNSPP